MIVHESSWSCDTVWLLEYIPQTLHNSVMFHSNFT